MRNYVVSGEWGGVRRNEKLRRKYPSEEKEMQSTIKTNKNKIFLTFPRKFLKKKGNGEEIIFNNLIFPPSHISLSVKLTLPLLWL